MYVAISLSTSRHLGTDNMLFAPSPKTLIYIVTLTCFHCQLHVHAAANVIYKDVFFFFFFFLGMHVSLTVLAEDIV